MRRSLVDAIQVHVEEQVYRIMGRRLRLLREARKLTQQEVAEEARIPYESYGDYERGNQRAPVGRAVQLADYFEVSLDYLVGRSDQRAIKKDSKDGHI